MKKHTGQKNLQGLSQKIINQIPEHSIYVELFAGSAAIFALLNLVNCVAILNDIDPEVKTNLQEQHPSAYVKNECAIKWLQHWGKVSDDKTFIFLYPPYHHSTRPNAKNLYRFEMTDFDHIQLLEAILQSKAKIMIIHPKCELYETMLSGWRKIEVTVRYHQKNSIECIYMNYDEPEQLQSYAFLGDNCTDRQRIKRKGDRMIKKLLQLPVLERNYILERLKAINSL